MVTRRKPDFSCHTEGLVSWAGRTWAPRGDSVLASQAGEGELMVMSSETRQPDLEQHSWILGQSFHSIWCTRPAEQKKGSLLCKVFKKAFVGPGLGQTGGVTERKAIIWPGWHQENQCWRKGCEPLRACWNLVHDQMDNYVVNKSLKCFLIEKRKWQSPSFSTHFWMHISTICLGSKELSLGFCFLDKDILCLLSGKTAFSLAS